MGWEIWEVSRRVGKLEQKSHEIADNSELNSKTVTESTTHPTFTIHVFSSASLPASIPKEPWQPTIVHRLPFTSHRYHLPALSTYPITGARAARCHSPRASNRASRAVTVTRPRHRRLTDPTPEPMTDPTPGLLTDRAGH